MYWKEAGEIFEADWRRLVLYIAFSLVGSILLAIYFRDCYVYQSSIYMKLGPTMMYIIGVLFSILTPYIHFIDCSKMIFWFVLSFFYWYLLSNVIVWIYDSARKKKKHGK